MHFSGEILQMLNVKKTLLSIFLNNCPLLKSKTWGQKASGVKMTELSGKLDRYTLFKKNIPELFRLTIYCFNNVNITCP